MVTDFEWMGIGAPAKLNSSSTIVTGTLMKAFEAESGLTFRKDTGGTSHDGKIISGWHIYGVVLREVELDELGSLAEGADTAGAVGPSSSETVPPTNPSRSRKRGSWRKRRWGRSAAAPAQAPRTSLRTERCTISSYQMVQCSLRW